MTPMKTEALIESILYVAGEEGISLKELSDVLEISKEEIRESVKNLKKDYDENGNRGLTLLDVAERIVLATKKEAEPALRKYAQAPFMTPLSKAALEILAIIAYKQPITRVEIDHIRGVQSGGSLQKLVLRGLVEEKGRVEGPGRPLLYGTTSYFLNYFGLNNLSELPELPEEDTVSQQEIDLFYGSSLQHE